MAQVTLPEEDLRLLLKQAFAEALDERRDVLRDLLAEVLEDVSLAEAIRKGRRSELVGRDEVFAELDRVP